MFDPIPLKNRLPKDTETTPSGFLWLWNDVWGSWEWTHVTMAPTLEYTHFLPWFSIKKPQPLEGIPND